MSSEEPTESEELVKVETLTPNSRGVNIVVKVVSKGEIRSVTGRDYSVRRVTDALVGDETASIYMTLWDERIDAINEGATLQITNGYINLFRGNMRLNVGKYGSYEVLEDSPIAEVNTTIFQTNDTNKRDDTVDPTVNPADTAAEAAEEAADTSSEEDTKTPSSFHFLFSAGHFWIVQ